MTSKDSYINHNSEYEQQIAFEREKAGHDQHNLDNFKFLYQDDLPHGNNLDKYTFDIAVDIGSGSAWFPNYLINHRNYSKIYAIEPSQAATDIAKRIYPDQTKVEYIVGFAEEEIPKLQLDKPTFFSTMCVLAHIPDEPVIEILKAIDKVAKVGSILSSSEPWGKEFHGDCWHIREPEWWCEVMPEWEFEFYADYVLPEPRDVLRYKGFTALKS
jgi:hypothetical protein